MTIAPGDTEKIEAYRTLNEALRKLAEAYDVDETDLRYAVYATVKGTIEALQEAKDAL
jgi:hypothetical protein